MKNKDAAQQQVDSLLRFLDEYHWLIDLYMTDVLRLDHFGKLSELWQGTMSRLTAQELSTFLGSEDCKHSFVWPLSLLCFRVCVRTLPFPRDPVTHMTIGDVRMSLSNEADHCTMCYGQWASVKEHAYRRHVKAKKQHEIDQLSKLICAVAKCSNVDTVVDVGGGHGHLGRLLHYKSGYNVITVDAETCHESRATQLDKQTEKNLKKKSNPLHNSDQPSAKLIHRTAAIAPAAGHLQFLSAIFNEPADARPFLLTGLHACGDLSVTLLHQLKSCDFVQSLVLAPCCYMRGDGPRVFPVSSYLQRRSPLSYEARELACHFIDTYRQRLISGDPKAFQSQVYRATLQELIMDRVPPTDHHTRVKIKFKRNMTFKDYACLALTALGLDSSLSQYDLERSEVRLQQWFKVVSVYTLRLSMAAIVETLLLLDRVLYLLENDFTNCQLCPIFNPEISPRNFVLIALKEKKTRNEVSKPEKKTES